MIVRLVIFGCGCIALSAAARIAPASAHQLHAFVPPPLRHVPQLVHPIPSAHTDIRTSLGARITGKREGSSNPHPIQSFAQNRAEKGLSEVPQETGVTSRATTQRSRADAISHNAAMLALAGEETLSGHPSERLID